MSQPAAAPAQPFYLRGSCGELFALHYPSARAELRLPGILLAPPFAEELNRARRMIALQARAFSRLGYDVLIVDLYGTGDSAGDFSDARWEIWLADLAAGAAWLRERGNQVIFWGLRLGAMLAVEAAHAEPGSDLLLWQPVVSGRSYLSQFLRIRLAAGLTAPEARGESTTTLRERLAAGEVLEVAGYGIAPELAGAIETRELAALPPPAGCRVHWYEISSELNGALLPASSRTVEAWRTARLEVDARCVGGEQFWATQEITISQPLLDATTAAFGRERR